MGKIHGSLARAGKVRSQTPKIEKQEGKKKPKGRALRRMKQNIKMNKKKTKFIKKTSR